jgi:hypothetical protein
LDSPARTSKPIGALPQVSTITSYIVLDTSKDERR